MKTALAFSHQLVQAYVKEGDLTIDATVGNGHDTVFLAQLVGPSGCVIGCDIQRQAIESAQKRLNEQNLLSRVDLYQLGHQNIDSLLPAKRSIQAAIFNLGYLPGGDKSIITQGEHTVRALSIILKRLNKNGLVVLVVYSGHEGGQVEKKHLENYLSQLNQKNFQVLKYQFINQANHPPFVLAIERIK